MSNNPALHEEIESYFDRLWPLLRSITGDGVRNTHDILSEIIPLESMEIPSGSKVFDWEVPKEWVVRDAYLIDPDGNRILDVWENNLHLINYSAPYRGEITLEELNDHLYSISDLPQAVPYVTSYYAPRWGFCLPHQQRESLPKGQYQVVIDTEYIDGSMTISESVLPGQEETEVLISTYTCHPSMANNELSGPLVSAFLYRKLAELEHRRLSYRFVFLPETIGSLAYLSVRGDHLKKRMIAGYVVTCVGDAGSFTYKRSRQGASVADRAAEHILAGDGGSTNVESSILDFFPDGGSDERQYCSPGFNLPVGSLMRTMYAKYPEYHTSLDNRDFISFPAMCESIEVYLKILLSLDMNKKYLNTLPNGEPQLSKRNLYPTLGMKNANQERSAILWLLNLSDGDNDLLSVSAKSGIEISVIHSVAQTCVKAGLLEPIQ